MSDLWPDDLAEIGTLQVPSKILKEQADALAKKTRNILQGKVYSSRDGDLSDNCHLISWHFAIFSPAINYTYELFQITHDIDLYPVSFYSEDYETREKFPDNTISDESQLKTVLRFLFASTRTQRIVKSLIAQSISQKPEPEPEPSDDIPF